MGGIIEKGYGIKTHAVQSDIDQARGCKELFRHAGYDNQERKWGM